VIDHTPSDATLTVRNDDGTTQPGRLTTSLEQYRDAVQHALATVDTSSRPDEVDVRVHWTRTTPSILRIRIRYETVTRKDRAPLVLALEDGVIELTESGAEIKSDFSQRYRQLVAEVDELARDGML
jgi:hypothetical protein